VVALSFKQVHDIQWRIENALSPYPEEVRPYTYNLTSDIPYRVDLPALLKTEPENQPPPEAAGFTVEGPFYDGNRPKRHRSRPGAHIEIRDGIPVVVPPTEEEFHRQSRVVVTNPSLHGITYQQPVDAPDGFIEVMLEEQLEEHLQIGQGSPATDSWRQELAISLVAATRIEAIRLHPNNIPYSRIAVATSLFGQQLVNSDPVSTWYDPETGTPVTFDIDPDSSDALRLSYQVARTLDMQLRRNTAATPSNALTHDGQPVGPRTYGLLQPASTIVTAVQIIGRESRRLGDGRGILNPPDNNIYLARTDPEAVAALIRKHYYWPGAATMIAEKTGLSVRTVSSILAGKPPSPRSAEQLSEFAYQAHLF